MRVVIQRVSRAEVVVDGSVVSSIARGLLVFLGVGALDDEDDIFWLCHKIVNLRIFSDDNGIMNHSVRHIDGDVIVVSQFTLYASTKKGHRPSYSAAASPELAQHKYNDFLVCLEKTFGKPVGSGVFGADMKVEILNDGPVTIIIDSKNRI